MNIKELHDALTGRFPKELSAPWDNDGIMCASDTAREVRRVLVSLDPTKAAIKYAAGHGFDTLVTHHPLIFKGLKSVAGADTVSSRVIAAMRSDIAVISLHTRLDAAVGGVNDALARALRFEVSGTFGDAEAPTLGRLARLHEAMDSEELAAHVENALASRVRVYGSGTVGCVALVGGSGKDFILPAMAAGADALITGESGYNMAEAAAEEGFVVIEAGHYETEFPVCETLAEVIRGKGIDAEVYGG